MPTIYITEKTRATLDSLTEAEKRSLSDEVEYLCDNRAKQLGLPDVNLSSIDAITVPNPLALSQEVNHG